MPQRAAPDPDPAEPQALAGLYLRSLAENRELSALACGGEVHELDSESTERMSRVSISPGRVRELCAGRPAAYLHTHANFLPMPSRADREADRLIFSLPGVERSCVLGNSGLACSDDRGRRDFRPWGEGYYEAVRSRPGISVSRGSSLYCDRDGEGYECELLWGGVLQPLPWAGELSLGPPTLTGELGADLFTQARRPVEVLECTSAQGDWGSTLGCYARPDPDGPSPRSGRR